MAGNYKTLSILDRHANIERSELPVQPVAAAASYDVAIAGGGLAGLALSIQCANAGYRVILFEKEQYPFQKVCGEYISLESWDFLEDLGLALSEMNLPIIHKLVVSAPNGKYLEHMLPLGGFGISRYKIDARLAEIARSRGVHILENTKVQEAVFEKEIFTITCSTPVNAAGTVNFQAGILAGTFGKRSNVDVTWRRKFILQKPNKLNNYIGVKYHIHTNLPADQIALHNFNNGYCGISRVEDNKYCLCYLTTAQNLNESNNSIKKMEQDVLCKNPFLKKIFSEAAFISAPEIISQISFNKKTQIENHTLLIGDAAGMISPLCGNGMSMALHGSKLAFEQIHSCLQKKISRQEMEINYAENWQQKFNKRLQTGRMIQWFFGNPALSNFFITSLKPFPGIVDRLISSTHGQPF